MAAAASLRHHLFRPPSNYSVLSPLQRQRLATLLSLPSTTSSGPSLPLFLTTRHCFLCTSSSTSSSSSSVLSHASTPPPIQLSQDQGDSDFNSDDEEEEQVVVSEEAGPDHQPPQIAPPLPSFPSLKLSVKEKKELASYAHSLGKKLKSQQVGKSGVTPSLAASFVETLEANELLKLKVHGSCPGELPDVIKQLEEATGSVAVGQIGRSVILYKPSLSKMKKKEDQSARKGWKPRPKEPAFSLKAQNKREVPRLSGHGHRGSRGS